MFCVNCGNELPDDANFCLKCGKPQQASGSVVSQEQPIQPIQPPLHIERPVDISYARLAYLGPKEYAGGDQIKRSFVIEFYLVDGNGVSTAFDGTVDMKFWIAKWGLIGSGAQDNFRRSVSASEFFCVEESKEWCCQISYPKPVKVKAAGRTQYKLEVWFRVAGQRKPLYYKVDETRGWL